jgi:hypothetical protein
MDININVENSKSFTESYEVVQKPSFLSPSFTEASEADEDQPTHKEASATAHFLVERLIIAGNQP